MTNETGGPPDLSARIVVGLSPERAFRTFTEDFSSWWPAEYHIGAQDMARAVIEAHEGGRWYEAAADGTECDWGRVLVWDPPHRLVITWQIDGRWSFDPDPHHASEIEVRFTEESPGQTAVDLEHRHLGRLVGGQEIHDMIEDGGGGWGAILARFAERATA